MSDDEDDERLAQLDRAVEAMQGQLAGLERQNIELWRTVTEEQDRNKVLEEEHKELESEALTHKLDVLRARSTGDTIEAERHEIKVF